MKHQHKSHPLKYFNLDFSYLSGINKLMEIFGIIKSQKIGEIIDLDGCQLEELDPRNPTVQTDRKSESKRAPDQRKSNNINFTWISKQYIFWCYCLLHRAFPIPFCLVPHQVHEESARPSHL